MSWEDKKGTFLRPWKAWWLARHPEDVGLYSWVYLFERGKQIRPRLFCSLWTYLSPETPVCVEGAFLLECAHVASLLLDDLPWMDDAGERRGWMTLHRMFSVRKALLVAHDVMELAYEVARSCPLFQERGHEWHGVERIQDKIRSLWLGQWMDVSRCGSLYEMAARKTGTLFEAVAEAVAIGVGLDPSFWREWGRALGVLFQWVDDWDDRQEDAQMGQRNAFLEAPDETMTLYGILWTHVVQGIGPGWWETSVGAYLMSYFTRVLVEGGRKGPDISPLCSLQTLPHLFQKGPLLPPLLLPSSREPPSPQEPEGLRFLRLFLPFLERLPTEQEKERVYRMDSLTEEEGFVEGLWSLPEDQWLVAMEKRRKIRPEMEWILLALRKVEGNLRHRGEWKE